MILQQHVWNDNLFESSGSGKQQRGHSPQWLSSGCWNNLSSRISANRFLHTFLCCGRWFFWHSTLQYFTRLHAHFLSFVSSISAMPQEAHTSSCSVLLMMIVVAPLPPCRKPPTLQYTALCFKVGLGKLLVVEEKKLWSSCNSGLFFKYVLRRNILY